MEAIIFDLGGVILDIDISKTNEAFRRLGFERIDDYFGLGHAGYFFKDYEAGKISDEEFIQRVRDILGEGSSEEKVIAAWNALLGEFPEERVEYLEGLKDRYRLFLFSNTNGIHLKYFKEDFRNRFGKDLDELFEKAYYSHLAGFRKPDAEGFLHILEENGLRAETTVFVDDALVNVKAARAVGLHGFHLEPGKKIEEIDPATWAKNNL